MEFSQATWLEGHKCRRNRLGNREIGRVNLAEHTSLASNLLSGVLQGTVNKRAISRCNRSNSTGDILLADGGVQDVRVRGRDVIEDGFRDSKILGQNILRGMGQPVINIECGSAVKSVEVRQSYLYLDLRTQLCRNRPHQRRGGTRSHLQDPVRYGRHPWGSTRCHHSSTLQPDISRFRRLQRQGRGLCIQIPIQPKV